MKDQYHLALDYISLELYKTEFNNLNLDSKLEVMNELQYRDSVGWRS